MTTTDANPMASNIPPLCRYYPNCTYGVNCKFYHPSSGAQVNDSEDK